MATRRVIVSCGAHLWSSARDLSRRHASALRATRNGHLVPRDSLPAVRRQRWVRAPVARVAVARELDALLPAVPLGGEAESALARESRPRRASHGHWRVGARRDEEGPVAPAREGSRAVSVRLPARVFLWQDRVPALVLRQGRPRPVLVLPPRDAAPRSVRAEDPPRGRVTHLARPHRRHRHRDHHRTRHAHRRRVRRPRRLVRGSILRRRSERGRRARRARGAEDGRRRRRRRAASRRHGPRVRRKGNSAAAASDEAGSALGGSPALGAGAEVGSGAVAAKRRFGC